MRDAYYIYVEESLSSLGDRALSIGGTDPISSAPRLSYELQKRTYIGHEAKQYR